MVDYGIARAKYLDAPVYRTAPRAVLPGRFRHPGDGSLVENIKWSEVSSYRAAPRAALPVALLLELEPPKRFGA